MRNKTPKPGIYKNITYDEYATWDAFNSHMVLPCLRSLKHLECYLKKEDEQDEKKCYTLGRMVECLIFEPGEFNNFFQIIPELYTDAKGQTKPFNMNSKTCKAIYAEIIKSRKSPIKAKDKIQAKTMADSLLSHTTARGMIKMAERGIAIVWKDETFGVLCKAFLDALTVDPLSADSQSIADIKTTINASKKDFLRQAGRFGYHVQGAFYIDGYRILTGKELPFDFLVVESGEPYCSAAYRLDVEAYQTGQGAYTRALKKYLGYLDGERSGYSEFIEEIQLPGYVVADEIQEEAGDDSINGI